MPSLRQSMVASPTIFAVEKRNAKILPSLIMVDNALGAQDAIITAQDVFTPAASNGTPVPVATTINRLRINVAQLACVSIQDELKNMEILGQLQLTIATPDINCFISVAWDFK